MGVSVFESSKYPLCNHILTRFGPGPTWYATHFVWPGHKCMWLDSSTLESNLTRQKNIQVSESIGHVMLIQWPSICTTNIWPKYKHISQTNRKISNSLDIYTLSEKYDNINWCIINLLWRDNDDILSGWRVRWDYDKQ